MAFLDGLRAAFKGGGAARPPLARGMITGWLGQALSTHRAPYEYETALRHAFLENPVAQRAVRIVAEGVGSAPLSETDPAATRLIATTSAGQSLLETLAMNLLLQGNGYVQISRDASGTPVELFALRPERVRPLLDGNGWPDRFEYRAGETRIVMPAEDADGWPALVHIRGLHPADDHLGAGCLSAARQAVDIHNAAAEWNLALLENAARPSGALVYDGGSDAVGLTGDQFDRLKAELAQAYSGGGNAGRPMLLEGGLKWQSLSLSPADMDFAELKAAAARDIALAFGVPPMLLGLPGDNTYSNYREANRALWRLTLLPLAAKILGGLQQALEGSFKDLSLSVDLDRVPALAQDRETLWSQVSGADFLTDDEKRALLGLAPRKEAD